LSLFITSAVFAAQTVRADDVSEAILKRLDALEKENGKLRSEIKRIESKTAQKPAPAAVAAPAPGSGKAVVDVAAPTGALVPTSASAPGYALTSDDPKWYFEKKPGDGLTFRTPGGEITAYGFFDVSFDVATKGITRTVGPQPFPSDSPVGNMGWLPDLSTNLSYIGVRGFQKVPEGPRRVGLEVRLPARGPARHCRDVGHRGDGQQQEQRGQERPDLAQYLHRLCVGPVGRHQGRQDGCPL
jgi:hypothetical protein